MFGFIFGTVCLLGLVGMARRAMWRHHMGYAGGFGPAMHGCGGHGYGGRRGGPWGRRRRGGPGEEGFVRAAAEVLKRRLRVDEEQEPVIDHAMKDAHAALKELRSELDATRAPIAEALRGETVDDAALAAAFARHDDAVARARREVVSAIRQVHAVLDADQRGKVADFVAAGKAEGGWL
jgi:uncharacterized membrane protein